MKLTEPQRRALEVLDSGPAWVDRRSAPVLLKKGWIEKNSHGFGFRYQITAAGRAKLREGETR